MHVLQVCHKPPLPLVDGGCIAMNNWTEATIMAGHTVSIIAFATDKHPCSIPDLPVEYVSKTSLQLTYLDTKVKLVPAFLNLFTTESYNIQRFYSIDTENSILCFLHSCQIDTIVLDGLYTTPYLRAIRKHYPAIRIVLRAHNIEHSIWQLAANNATNFLQKSYYNFLAKRLKKYELDVFQQVDAISTLSTLDEKCITDYGIATPITTIGIGYVGTQNTVTVVSDSLCTSFFYIGAMDWFPNIEGIEWFLEKVWKDFIVQNPTTTFTIAGKSMPTPWLENALYKNVIVKGKVDNAQQFMQEQGILLAPLLTGGGTRVKIIEALSLGKIIITTSLGAEGLPVTHLENIIIADTPVEYTYWMNELLKNKELGKQISTNARQFSQQHFDIKPISKQINDLLVALHL